MDSTLPRTNRPKSRQSLAHPPSSKTAASERENATADVSFLRGGAEEATKAEKKKTRGKSLGPGGLEALKESTGNSIKTTSSFQIKSILKPTVPLTPPKVIPSFDELRKRSTSKAKSPAKPSSDDLLIDFSTPAPSRSNAVTSVQMSGAEIVVDPFSPITRSKSPKGQTVTVRTEMEQQDAARAREEEIRRKSDRQAILDQRAARRKSMANRRVSFAPEATLHTWSVMELAEDSTTSSASNSTRRQSSMTAAQSPAPVEHPSTPPEPAEEPQVKASPARQPDAHEAKRRRRSSALPPALFQASTDEIFSSSPGGDSLVESSPLRVEESIHSDDDTEDDEDTAMSLDNTSNTMASHDSASSTQSSLDERLRRAASMAGTRGIEYDEHGDDLPMELATGTITNAFQPWVNRQAGPVEELSAMQDQENVNPFSPPSKADTALQQTVNEEEDATQDMSMDVTRAVGGILSVGSPGKGKRKSVGTSRRRSSVARRRSSGEPSGFGDETMDFTTAAGGIIQLEVEGDESVVMSDEDITMEFTNVLGGVLSNQKGRRESIQSANTEENETMDMTVAVGGILAPIEEQTEPVTDVEDNDSTSMDMTSANGAVLPSPLRTNDRNTAKQLMQMETDIEQMDTLAKEALSASKSPSKSPSNHTQHVTSVASETGSPSLTVKRRLSGRNKSIGNGQSTTPKSTPLSRTPTSAKQLTPTKQVTPLAGRSQSANKTLISANVALRGASPKKLFRAEIKARASPGGAQKSPGKARNAIFDVDEKTGHHTPSVVLHAPKPHQHLRRRSSGIGIDKDGIGSPRVSEILSRRTSIGEVAPAFAPQAPENRILRFDDPKLMEHELDAELAEDERRESGRFVMEQEVDEPQEENVTLQLREMIDSMTPKKNNASKLKGRKSLAVGGARGILGKRPAELDMDDEDEGDSTPKRLKAVSREASPVKQIHLPKPPTKDETTGRTARASIRSHVNGAGDATPTMAGSPIRRSVISSPQHTGHFKELPVGNASTRPSSFEDQLDNVLDAVDLSTVQLAANQGTHDEEEKISLQAFLNMTNIHFIELSTTKRRHTMAPEPSRPSQEGVETSLEACFSTAATTLPLLELYQHATRELKSYISSGRKIIRTIEAETLAAQPTLFREYVDARPDVKMVMDNQFRNGKTNARLQSKEGWYAWRGQLVDGLRAGLEGIKKGMENDATQLKGQQETLSAFLPQLSQSHVELEQQVAELEQTASDSEAVDQNALAASRLRLKEIDAEYAKKAALLQTLKEQMNDKEETLSSAEELKAEMRDQIAEADRVREECQGWAVKDVLALKETVDVIEKETGWSLVTAEEDADDPNEFGVALTMIYKDVLRLFFYPAAYQASSGRRRSGRRSRSNSGPTAPIGLIYSPKPTDDLTASSELATEKRFFLQLIRSQLHAFSMMSRCSLTTKTLLDTVSNGWEMASRVAEEIRLLNMAGITTASILGDERVGAKLMLIIDGKSRVDIDFGLTVSVEADGSIFSTTGVNTTAVYGPVKEVLTSAKSRKVQHALDKEVEGREIGTGAWINAVRGFEQWLQGQQGQQAQPPPKPKQKQQPASDSVAVAVPEIGETAPSTSSATPAPAPASVRRSPLTAKKTNIVQKKSIPVPQSLSRLEKVQTLMQQRDKERAKEKENVPLPDESPGQEMWKPAIAPELQEVMMNTPVKKRVGALRRSPI